MTCGECRCFCSVVYGMCADSRSRGGPVCEFDRSCDHFELKDDNINVLEILRCEVTHLKELARTVIEERDRLIEERDRLVDELAGLKNGEFASLVTVIAKPVQKEV